MSPLWFSLLSCLVVVVIACLLFVVWSSWHAKRDVQTWRELSDHIHFSKEGFLCQSQNREETILFRDVVGVAKTHGAGEDEKVDCALVIITVYRKKNLTSSSSRYRIVIEVVCKNEEEARNLSDKVKTHAFGETREKVLKVVIVVNPISGTKVGVKLADELCDLLRVKGARVVVNSVWKTSHAGHALEMGEGWESEQGDIVALVGGDGLLHEFGNGLLRTNKSLPMLALVPAGTGNGFAKSIGLERCDVREAAFRILRGKTRLVDALEVNVEGSVRAAFEGMKYQPRLKRYCFSSVSYGIIADVDWKSERWRWMGSARFQLEAFRQIVMYIYARGKLRVDNISMRFLPEHKAVENTSSNFSEFTGPFLSIVVSNVPFLSHDMQFHPWADVGDGFMDISVVCKMSRWVLLYDLFLNVERGKHVQRERVKATTHYVKATRVLFREYDPQSVLDIDGEFVWGGTVVSIDVLPGTIRMIV